MSSRREVLMAGIVAPVTIAAPLSIALAQAGPGGTATPPAAAADQPRVRDLIDRDVYTSDNVEVGEVEDLILDAQGRIVTAIIELEGRLGFTEKYVAVPFARLRPDRAQRRVHLQMTRDEVRALPGFQYRD